jgi:hypothetical protein
MKYGLIDRSTPIAPVGVRLFAIGVGVGAMPGRAPQKKSPLYLGIMGGKRNIQHHQWVEIHPSQ